MSLKRHIQIALGKLKEESASGCFVLGSRQLESNDRPHLDALIEKLCDVFAVRYMTMFLVPISSRFWLAY